MNKTTAVVAQKIIRELVKAVRKDASNRYRLIEPWTLPRLSRRIPDYEDELFLIRDSVITIKTYGGDICDGASLAPDRIGPWKMVIGSLFHDAWYYKMCEIAEAWQMPLRDVRLLGDDIFYGILAIISPRLLSRIYYRAVRLLGGHYNSVGRMFKRLVLVAAFSALLCAGCSGCAVPGHIFENPEDFVAPEYEQVEQ